MFNFVSLQPLPSLLVRFDSLCCVRHLSKGKGVASLLSLHWAIALRLVLAVALGCCCCSWWLVLLLVGTTVVKQPWIFKKLRSSSLDLKVETVKGLKVRFKIKLAY